MSGLMLSGAEKAAIVLLSLETDMAARLFQELDDAEMREISQAMVGLGKISSEITEKVVIEFSQQLNETLSVVGNFSNTERFLRKILSDDKVDSLVEEIREPIGKNIWDKLSKIQPRILTGYLKNEHPQTIALVMTKLDPECAAKNLSLMSSSIVADVLFRMASMTSVNRDVINNIEKTIKNEFIGNANKIAELDNNMMVAEIFNSLDKANEERFMEMLEKRDHILASQIRKLMFTFEDLLRVDSQGIQLLLRTLDKEQLAIALKGANSVIIDLVASNMSQRAYKFLSEEIEGLGGTRARDIEQARRYVVATAKEMLRSGSINLVEVDEEEFVEG